MRRSSRWGDRPPGHGLVGGIRRRGGRSRPSTAGHQRFRLPDPGTAAAAGSLGDDERGSAALEFITVGVLMLVPLVYLVVTLGLVQSHALGAESAARFAARAIADAPDEATAAARADATIADITGEYGMDAGRVVADVRCIPAGSACPTAGATVIVTIRTEVALPFVPPVLGLDRLATVPVEASSGQKVSRFWTGE